MDDAKRYDKEWGRLMADVELRAKRAQELKSAETFDSLLAASAQVGINRDAALKTIEANPNDYQSGAIRLIDEIKQKRTERLKLLRDRIDKKGQAILDSDSQWEDGILKFSHPFESLSDDEETFIDEQITSWKVRVTARHRT